jgi:hypothetical protein
MAERGYLLVREDDAEAKALRLAAQKRGARGQQSTAAGDCKPPHRAWRPTV